MGKTTPQRAFLDTPEGQLHYAESGSGEPVLFLHQTPRSWDEYREVLPLVGACYRALAMDTLGYGDSSPSLEGDSIEAYAGGVLELIDALALSRVHIVGHHTGGVIAIEVAARAPERVGKLILSCTPFVDAADRQRRHGRPSVDDVDEKPDGSHLVQLWRNRQSFYPPQRPDLLMRFVSDALKAGPRMSAGHHAVDVYHMEERLPLIEAPTLVLAGDADPFSFPRMMPLAAMIPGSVTTIIEGGTVAMVDQMPEQFARVVLDFLQGPGG